MRVYDVCGVHIARSTRCTVYVVLAAGFTVDFNRPSPVPVAARSKAWVCSRWHAGIAGSNPTGAWMSVVSVVCCQVEVSATGRSLVRTSRTYRVCGVSGCVI